MENCAAVNRTTPPWIGGQVKRPSSSRLVARTLIGIGGPLTRPPLPHHRAYGSVPRRFGGLSVYQLFHGEEAQAGEASFGEGAVQSFHGAQPPGSLRAEDSRTGQPFGDLEAAKFPVSPAARLPLDPNDASQSPSDPAVE